MPTNLSLARERVLIEEHVAQQTSRPQPSLFVQRGPQEFVGAEMTFQQEVHLAIVRHADCDGGCVIRADKLCPGDQAEEPERLRLGADLSLVADQHRNGNPEMQRAIGCGQGNLVVSRNDGDALGTQRLSAAAEFGEVRYFLSGKCSSAEDHDLILARTSLALQ